MTRDDELSESVLNVVFALLMFAALAIICVANDGPQYQFDDQGHEYIGRGLLDAQQRADNDRKENG